MIKNGCFDPIRKTQTVNARCLSNRHCDFLENTECVPNYQDPGVKTCRCKKGTLPKPHLKDTGLVPGCEQSEFTKMLSVEHCKRRFTLGAHTVSQKNKHKRSVRKNSKLKNNIRSSSERVTYNS